MSANRLFVTVLFALGVLALAVRLATGPLPALTDADSRYAAAKFAAPAGPIPASIPGTVQMAVGDTPAGP